LLGNATIALTSVVLMQTHPSHSSTARLIARLLD